MRKELPCFILAPPCERYDCAEFPRAESLYSWSTSRHVNSVQNCKRILHDDSAQQQQVVCVRRRMDEYTLEVLETGDYKAGSDFHAS